MISEIQQRYQAVRARITQAALQASRNPDDVQLLAVSKTFAAEKVREVAALGQRDFGENYVQEGVDKIAVLKDVPSLVWHCIGPLQSNKTRPVAEHFDWVHSVDRLKIAQRLSEQRPADLPPLNICLQVNIDGGSTKAGVSPTDALALARAVSVLPRLVLRHAVHGHERRSRGRSAGGQHHGESGDGGVWGEVKRHKHSYLDSASPATRCSSSVQTVNLHRMNTYV